MESVLEHVLVNSTKASMVSYMDSHPEEFRELVELALTNKQPYSWRAAWLLWSCMEVNDSRLDKHIHRMIDSLPSFKDEQQRELFIILYKLKVPLELEGILFNICIGVWEKTQKKPSVRLNAFKLIAKMANRYPELAKELNYFTQDQYLNTLSSNARKSILRMSGVK